MTKDSFWSIIDEARGSSTDCEQTAASVVERLRATPPADVLAFCRHIEERLADSYRYDLWAVAYIVNGGCSDDGFEYFRGWLIAQGREYFEAALAQPERAADHAEPGEDDNECEDILYAPSALYQKMAGQPLPRSDVHRPSVPLGMKWSEEDLEELYPELCARYFS